MFSLLGKVNEDAIVVQDLCKSFGSFAAVSNLSFGVHYGECFGLLGECNSLTTFPLV